MFNIRVLSIACKSNEFIYQRSESSENPPELPRLAEEEEPVVFQSFPEQTGSERLTDILCERLMDRVCSCGKLNRVTCKRKKHKYSCYRNDGNVILAVSMSCLYVMPKVQHETSIYQDKSRCFVAFRNSREQRTFRLRTMQAKCTSKKNS